MEDLVKAIQENNELLREFLEKQMPKPKKWYWCLFEAPVYFFKSRLAIIAAISAAGYVGLTYDHLPEVGTVVRQVQQFDTNSNTLTTLERGAPVRYFLQNGDWYSEDLQMVEDAFLQKVKESITEGKEFPKEKWLW